MTPTHQLDQVNQIAEGYIDTGDLSSVTGIPGQEICTESVTLIIPLHRLTTLLQGWKSYWKCAKAPLQMVFYLKCSNWQICTCRRKIFINDEYIYGAKKKKLTAIVKIAGFSNLECLNNFS